MKNKTLQDIFDDNDNLIDNFFTKAKEFINKAKTECVRCGVKIEEEETHDNNKQHYCECCYDDMFVSWGSK